MSDLFASKFKLHVYLSEHPNETGGLDKLRSSVSENPDRDVVIDFASVSEFNQQETVTLLRINELLTQAGHQLVLQSTTPKVEASFAVLGVSHVFKYALNRDTPSNSGSISYH